MTDYSFGKFVWFDIKTNNPKECGSFYSDLFGWTTKDMPIPSGSYTMFHAGDRTVGGIASKGDVPSGVPDHWWSWISVEDVDATVAKIRSLGGKVVEGPFEMPDMMRMALCQDPEGAAFAIMKAKDGDQPDVDSYPGIFYWNELYADDAEAAVAFYTGVFGYEAEKMPMPNGDYFVIKSGGVGRGGIMAKPDPEIPSMWLPYVHVADVDKTIAQAVKAGAKLMNEIMDIPGIGRFGMFLDPRGGAIAAMTPAAAAEDG